GGTGNAGGAGNGGSSGSGAVGGSRVSASNASTDDSGCGCIVAGSDRRSRVPVSAFALAWLAAVASRRFRRRPSAKPWRSAVAASALVLCGSTLGCSDEGSAGSGGAGTGGSGNATTGGTGATNTGGAGNSGTGGAGATNTGGAGNAGTGGDAGSAGQGPIEPFYTTPYVQVMTPMPSATYFAPATIRIWGHAPTVDGYAERLDFYLGTTLVDSAARSNRIDYYEVTATDVPAGTYEIYARNEDGVESVHVPITVIDVPDTDVLVQDLTSDLVLSGADDLEILGTPEARALLTSSNGSRIRSAPDWTGHLTLRNADVIGLGDMDVPSIEVSVGGTSTIEISNSVFDRTGPLALGADDQASIVLRGNTFQPNLLTPVNDEADYAGSHPCITLGGNSSARKYFQGNNVGVSFVRFASSHWQVGGTEDADGNIFLGVRAGMEFAASGDDTLQGNFSYHRYPYGWSQGHNLDFEGDSQGPSLVEHNIFRGSSWMIQSMNGEFRYNLLVDNINEAFFRYTEDDTQSHHNVLVNVGYQRQYSPSGGMYYLGATNGVYNNTVDVGGERLGWFDSPMMRPSSGGSARNNVFTGFAYQRPNNLFDVPQDDNPGDWAQADYNCFYNPDTQDLTPYANSAFGAHDCGGAAGADPQFARARSVPFPFGDGDIWQRRVTVSEVLSFYRAMYTPLPDSPLVDQGDPTDDTGGVRNTDIGAVGAGNPHPDDLFGTFGQ
ncbi:MAG TPA: hypothetical protein VF103_17660, partial [Polyangiaceae bacterium]